MPRRTRQERLTTPPPCPHGGHGDSRDPPRLVCAGVERTQERADPNPFGKPTNYHWLYFVDGPDHNMTVVPFGQKCRPNECHALLDPAKDFDADPVEGSNETFEMASTNADPNSGLLGCRQYPCPCLSCWPSASFRPDHECESIMTVGRWRQATCFSAAGIGRQQTAKRQAIGKFAASVVPDKLYAAVGAFADRGRRPYWLLRTVSAAFKPPTTLKCTGGATVSTSQWAVKAYWYEAESDDANHRSYKICPGGVVDLPLNCLVQASDLEFHRNMRDEAGGVRGVLTVQSHLSIVAHNLDNYK